MKLKPWQEYLPYLVVLLIVVFMFNCVLNKRDWKKENYVISWDIISYYGYLPATFIYHDYSLDFTETYTGPHKFTIWYDHAPNGNKVIWMSMGLSMLYAPFFFLGHLFAKFNGFDAGGYSEPYRFALLMSCLFYVLIGLIYLVRLLKRFFNNTVTILVLLIIVFGTNLFYYSVYSTPLSHAYNFSLIVVFIYYSIKWHEKPKIKYTILVGLLIGLITLIRPTNVVSGLFFLLWDIKSYRDIQNRFIVFINKWPYILLIIVLCLLVWLPQMLYWKVQTGHFLFYSYGETNRFFFNHPRIFRGLFSYRNGWLVYTPVMIFSLAGIPLLWEKYRSFFYPVLVVFLLHIYLIYSWFCWWYGGSFGSRPMVDIYGLFAIPLGVFLTETIRLKKIYKGILYSLVLILFSAGIWHTHKYMKGSIHYDAMTKAAFWDSYFRATPTLKYYELLECPDHDKARQGIDAIKDCF